MTNNSQMAIYPFFSTQCSKFLIYTSKQLLANFHFLVVPQPTSDASSLVDSYDHIYTINNSKMKETKGPQLGLHILRTSQSQSETK